jgi:hypothetical protein
MPALIGINGVAYRTSQARTTWPGGPTSANTPYFIGSCPNSITAMGGIATVMIDPKWATDDVSVRASQIALKTKTLQAITAKIEIPWDPNNADCQFLMDGFIFPGTIPLLIMDSAITTGVQGIWADWVVIEGPKDQNITKAQRVTFTLEPGNATNIYPQWVQSS